MCIRDSLYISFIEKLSTDISGSPSTDIVAGDRVHDNLHGSVGSGVYQEIQPATISVDGEPEISVLSFSIKEM